MRFDERTTPERSVVARNQQRPLFGQPRPRCHLDDGADRSRAGARAHLAQAVLQTRAAARRPRAGRARAGFRPTPRARALPAASLTTGAGSSASFGPSAAAQPVAIGGGVAKRHRPPPRAAADEAPGKRELAQGPATAFRPGEQPVDEHAERAPQRQLVADRFREVEPLDELRRGTAPAHASLRAASRQPPGAPAVRPQSFGDGATRQPGKLSEPLDPELLQLVAAARARARSRSSGSGARKSCVSLVGDDQRLARARDVRRREGGELPRRLPTARASQPAPTAASARLQRRLDAAVEPLDAAGSRSTTQPSSAGSTAKPASSSRADDPLPRLLGRCRIVLDEHERRARRRAPRPAASPA